MRRIFPILVLTATLFAAPAALAGPTCQDRNGDTIRCGTPGAMPVGWALPLQERLNRPPPEPVAPGTMLGLLFAIGGFFTLIALMPDFQSERGGWDRSEGDDEAVD
jgi:hypothetical protein